MILDKNALIALIATNCPDNNEKFTTNARMREVLNQMVTSDINLAELTEQVVLGLINVKALQFETATPKPPYRKGQTFFDNTADALSYYNSVSDTTINMGQEVVAAVYNNTGVTITNGQSVRLGGSSIDGAPTVQLSLADTVEDAETIGVSTHDIENGSIGYITIIGSVGGLDTSMYAPGDILFVSETVPGELTNVPPSIVSRVAIVVEVSATDGRIYTSIKEVDDPKAFGQNTQGAASSIPVSTTPTPMEGYSDTPFSKNMIIQTPVGANGDFRTIISPQTNPFGGYYDLAFNFSFTSTANVIVIGEVYINGAPTGVRAIADLSNGQIDAGTISIPRALTNAPIGSSDEMEIYVYTAAGTATLTVDSLLINSERIGNI